ncbi:MAG: integrin alpha [Lysobacterales bacterium]
MKSILSKAAAVTLLLPCLSQAQIVEPEAQVLLSLYSEQPGDAFGWVAEGVGDIDGDGYGDFLTGAPFLFNNGFPAGKVYLYSGADGSEIFSSQSIFGTRAGYSVAGLGDVTGDGVPDYVYSEIPVVIIRSGADHSIWQVMFQSRENFGWDVNNAGDLDGDGYNDVIIGASAASATGGNFEGRIYAYSSATGALIWQADGTDPFGFLGEGVGPVGDVNDDGVPDVVAAAPGAGNKQRGEAYVLSGIDGSTIHTLKPVGRPGVLAYRTGGTFGSYHTAGGEDFDGDGVNDIYIGDYAAVRGQSNPNSPNAISGGTGRAYVFSGATGEQLLLIDAENNGDGIGPGRLTPDADGDGLADIYTAAFLFGDNSEGKGYVLGAPDGAQRATHTGAIPGDALGVDATWVDDTNGDGHFDYILTGNGVLHVISGDPQ